MSYLINTDYDVSARPEMLAQVLGHGQPADMERIREDAEARAIDMAGAILGERYDIERLFATGTAYNVASNVGAGDKIEAAGGVYLALVAQTAPATLPTEANTEPEAMPAGAAAPVAPYLWRKLRGPRPPALVNALTDIAVYLLLKRVAPGRIDALRQKSHDEAIAYLRGIASGEYHGTGFPLRQVGGQVVPGLRYGFSSRTSTHMFPQPFSSSAR